MHRPNQLKMPVVISTSSVALQDTILNEYADRDLVFYEEPAESGCIILKAGDFAIVPPEDAHAPRRQTAAGPCAVKKIVVKVKV